MVKALSQAFPAPVRCAVYFCVYTTGVALCASSIFAQWSAQHIKTPTFPMQSQYQHRSIQYIHIESQNSESTRIYHKTDPTHAVSIVLERSRYDAWQTGNVMGKPDAGSTAAATQNAFGVNLTALVKSDLLSQPQHGIFLDSCHHHCGAWDGPEIEGKLIGAALQEWYTMGSQKLPNKGFYNQAKPFPCDACCKPGPGH